MAKMLRYIRGFGLVAVSVVLIAALLLGSVVPAKAAEEKVVKIGIHTALTGPLATTVVPAHYGIADYIKYVNEQGGIHGAKLQLEWENTGANITRCIIGHKRFSQAGVVFEMHSHPGGAELLAPRYQKEEIPGLFLATMTREMITYPERWVFAFLPGSGPEMVTFMKWVKDNWIEARPPRIALIGFDVSIAWEASEFGAEWAPKFGIEWTGCEIVPLVGCIDTSTEWLRLANKKPGWVFAYASMQVLVVIMKDAKRLEIQERGIKLCSHAAGIDEILVRAVGVDASEGWFASRPHPSPVETDVPGVSLARDIIKKYRGLEEASSHYMGACAICSTIFEAIRLAIEKVGYQNLNGRAVRDAMVTIKDFIPFGQISPPVTITEERPYVVRDNKYYQIRDGKIWPYTDWIPYAYHYAELTKGR